MRLLPSLGFLFALAHGLTAAPVFQDGFESGSLAAPWTTDRTNTGRVTVETQFDPASGQRHLVLDDEINDAVGSVAEAILQLDLTRKRSVVLTFKAKSLGNEPDPPPAGNFSGTRAFDAVTISLDGGVTWRTAQSLASIGTAWMPLSVDLDPVVAAMGGAYGPDVRLRFSGYDNSPAPLDGLAIDDVLVEAVDEQRTSLELPGTSFAEGSGPHTGYVVVSSAPATPLTLTLTASPSDQVTLPPSVIVPAGETAVSFAFSIPDDLLYNPIRPVALSATAPGVSATASIIGITDNEALKVAFTVPAQVTEGEAPSLNARLAIDAATVLPLRFTLSATPAGQLSLPYSVTIQSGQTEVRFTVRAINDTVIDGNVPVTLRATTEGLDAVTAESTAIDNEPRVLTLEASDTIVEGETLTGTVRLSGTMTTDLAIGLETTPGGLVELVQPVTIRAGQTQASVQFRAANNTVSNPTRHLQVRLTAPGFTGTALPLVLYDDDPASYAFETTPDVVQAGATQRISLNAVNYEGVKLTGYTGPVNLVAELPDGREFPLTPVPVTVSAGSWNDTISIPHVDLSPIRLRATDATGRRGVSSRIEVMRSLSLRVSDLIWDRFKDRLYASVSSAELSPLANSVISINPLTLEVVGRVDTGHNPTRLALSDGGERLYAALEANGTMATIEPDGFSLLNTFPVAAPPDFGVRYAVDMVVGAGRPGLVVAVVAERGISPGPNRVYAYLDGALLPGTASDAIGCRAIELSPEPGILLAYSLNDPVSSLRRLRLGENGVAWEESTPLPDLRFSLDFASEGGTAVFSSADLVDSATGHIITSLPGSTNSGVVASELSRNRVFSLRRTGIVDEDFRHLNVYDTATRSITRSLYFDPPLFHAGALVRWGANGLAVRTADSIKIFNSPDLAPSLPPADLKVDIEFDPYPVTETDPYPHVIRVTNRGPGTAHGIVLDVTFAGSSVQPQNPVASQGVADRIRDGVTAALGELAPGQSATVRVLMPRFSAPTLATRAVVGAASFDPDRANNLTTRFATRQTPAEAEAVTSLMMGGNAMVYDAKRRRLLVSYADEWQVPAEGRIMALDPLSGRIAPSIGFYGRAAPGSMALSANGRYLYLGLNDTFEVLRFDLDSEPPAQLRIPMPRSVGSPQRASDIEVLDGDGTSFIVVTQEAKVAFVIDGSTPRPKSSFDAFTDRVEPTGVPGLFAGFGSQIHPQLIVHLEVTADGVTATKRSGDTGLLGADLAAAGAWALTSGGRLYNIAGPSYVRVLEFQGRPCLDIPNGRAMIVNANGLVSFDLESGAIMGALPMANYPNHFWADACVRWGLDGIAVLSVNTLFLGRWSQIIAPAADVNANDIPDRWEASNLGPFGGDLADDPDGDGLPSVMEYVFGTPAGKSTADPRQVSVTEAGLVRLVFPRRAGLGAGWYAYEAAARLDAWSTVTPVSESVLSTQTVDGVEMETVEVLLQLPAGESGYVRLVALPR